MNSLIIVFLLSVDGINIHQNVQSVLLLRGVSIYGLQPETTIFLCFHFWFRRHHHDKKYIIYLRLFITSIFHYHCNYNQPEMKPAQQFVAYFNDEETASPETHEVIDRNQVSIRKSVSYLSEWKMAR